jgi:mannosyltransferase
MGSQHAAVDVLAPERVVTAVPDPARVTRVVWVWPALLMLAVGCYRLTGPELWRDELSSWSFASRPIPELTATVQHSDASQLAYYLLLHYWIAAFGDSVLAMRLPSVLAMTGAAACVTLIGRKLAGGRAGLLGGLVFALVPSISRFSQETRFYALEVLVAMLATLALLCALERPGIGRWALYACSVAVLGYVDLVALCLLAGHAVAVALQLWRSRRRALSVLGFLPAAMIGCAACLPLALVGLEPDPQHA